MIFLGLNKSTLISQRFSNYMTAAEMRAVLKKRDPLIGTPGGALRAYRSRAKLTQHAAALKAGLKQSHLSEMEQNKRPMWLGFETGFGA